MSRWIRPALVGVLQRLGHRQDDLEGRLLVEDLVLVELVLDRRPLDVLHHEVVVAVDLAGVDRVDDVVVRELGGDLGLAVEPLDELLVLRQRVEQDLDGDDPVDARSAWPCRRPPSTPCRACRGSGSRGSRTCVLASPDLLEQPHRLALGQDLGLDHDLEQALASRRPWPRAWPGGPCTPRSPPAWPARGGGSTSRGSISSRLESPGVLRGSLSAGVAICRLRSRSSGHEAVSVVVSETRRDEAKFVAGIAIETCWRPIAAAEETGSTGCRKWICTEIMRNARPLVNANSRRAVDVRRHRRDRCDSPMRPARERLCRIAPPVIVVSCPMHRSRIRPGWIDGRSPDRVGNRDSDHGQRRRRSCPRSA